MTTTPRRSSVLWQSIVGVEDCMTVDVLSTPYEHSLCEQGLPVGYGPLVAAATEVHLHPSLFMYLGLVHVDGWALGRPAKRLKRLPMATREAMANTVAETTAAAVHALLAEGVLADPQAKQRWGILLNLSDPVTQTGPDGNRKLHTCLLFLWNRRLTILDPLGSSSPFRVLLVAALRDLPATLSTTSVGLVEQCHWVDRPLYNSPDRCTSVLWVGWAIDQLVSGRDESILPSVRVYTLLEWLGRVKAAIGQFVFAHAGSAS